MQRVPRSPAAPRLADPGTQPSLQFVAGEVYMGRERPRIVEDPPPAPPPLKPMPRPATPSALPAPAVAPLTTPLTGVKSTPVRKRWTRAERRERRRIRAARLRARWRKVSPYFAAQLVVLGLAVTLAEWLELHGNQPLLCRLIVAFGTGFLTASLWLVYVRRHGPGNLHPS